MNRYEEDLIVAPNGKIVSSRFDSFLSGKIGKTVRVTVVVPRQKRSLDQNNYFHLICAGFAEFSGDTPDSVKNAVKKMFLSKGVRKNIFGQEEVETADTSSLDTLQFAQFLEKVISKFAEFGYIAPTPEYPYEGPLG